MTKTERQQAAIDELFARCRKCAFAGITIRHDCNDPRSVIYRQVSSWCFNCLCDELAGAKVAEQEDNQVSDKREPRRWVCRNDHLNGLVVEVISLVPPKLALDATGWWCIEKNTTDYILSRMDCHKYAQLTGIRLEPGDGPIELKVEVKHD